MKKEYDLLEREKVVRCRATVVLRSSGRKMVGKVE